MKATGACRSAPLASSAGCDNSATTSQSDGSRFIFCLKHDAAMRKMVEAQIEEQSLAPFLSGKLYDDGVIDPRDTRTVLALCLSAVHSGPIKGADGFGVFRM